jgi:hypothetical protein
MRRGSHTTNRLRAVGSPLQHRAGAWANPGRRLVQSTLWHPSYLQRSVQVAGSAARRRDSQETRDYFRDHNCPAHFFRPISSETLGPNSNGAMQFIREVAHGPSQACRLGEYVADFSQASIVS